MRAQGLEAADGQARAAGHELRVDFMKPFRPKFTDRT
jgi:hypothetical protein